MLLRALLPCLLVATGGCITIFDPDQVTYELQVRDPLDGSPLGGVAIHVEIGNSLEIREGGSDAGGLFFMRCEVPLFGRTYALRPWMRFRLSREGYEPKTLDFWERDFIREGRHLRRMEAVTLQRKAS